MAVNTINELITLLNQVDVDATVLAKISNNSAMTDEGAGAGLVTTRLGSNVKNVQKVIADIQNGLVSAALPTIQEEGVNVVAGANTINFVGVGVTVTDVGGVATITIAGGGGGGGDVTKVGTPANNQLAVWTGDGTIEGESAVTWSNPTLTLTSESPTLNFTDVSASHVSTIVNNNSELVISVDTTDFVAASAIILEADGVELARFTPAGLGLGGRTPFQAFEMSADFPRLDLYSNSATFSGFARYEVGPSGEIRIQSDPTNAELFSFINFSVDGIDVARLNEFGRLGIGQIAPLELLHVEGDPARLLLQHTGSTGFARVSADSADGTLLLEADPLNVGIDSKIEFRIDGSPAVQIDKNGNIDLIRDGYITSSYQVREIIAATHDFQLTDSNGIILMNNGGANAVTIQDSATIAYTLGFVAEVIQTGSGATSIAAAVGVTLNGVSDGTGTLTSQYSVVKVINIAPDVWVVSGDIGAIT